MEQFIGEIQLFAFVFAPRNWAYCNGQLLPINQNQALFSLLGTTYGGDGRVTFALPDLRGKSMIHFGQGTGLSFYAMGQTGGSQNATLTIANMPSHTHSFAVGVNTNTGTSSDATGRIASQNNSFSDDTQNGSFLGGVTSGTTGLSQPVSIQNPYLGINHCIAISGIFPSRN